MKSISQKAKTLWI